MKLLRYSAFCGLLVALSLLSGTSCAHRGGHLPMAGPVLVEEKQTPSDGTVHNSGRQARLAPALSGHSAKVTGLEIPAPLKNTPERILRRTGFVESYNSATRIPSWVAWHLTAAHTDGPVQRKDYDYMDDGSVPDPKEYSEDYRHSGWTHGHMCPAGDNKWSAKAMADCFLVTNMCPQAAGLNSGLWNTIEKRCREWAQKYGDVYIVCGPVLLRGQHQTIGRNRVVVPEAFFKVVLCMRGTPKAIGFICRNQSAKGRKPVEFVNTVDEVERITGIDFFPALPDRIETEVESHCDLNNW
ncbi:MAG: DNA/RNA non-specific endonuclease [Prevotella sp.]|nr:DNA/RNA non-specific endonuclease [Prevotella sp.]